MNIDTKVDQAEKNLERQLEWVSKYDSRAGFIAALLVAVLGVLANASSSVATWNIYLYLVSGIGALLLLIALLLIYISQYPRTKSQNSSLIFFETISSYRCDEFKKKFTEITKEEYLEDLLEQIHINSLILDKKFTYLKYSLRLLALAIIPWLLTIYFSGIYLN